MSEEIGRREFIKRGTIAGVVATTGLPLAAASAERAASAPPATPLTGATVAGDVLGRPRWPRGISTARSSVSPSTTR